MRRPLRWSEIVVVAAVAVLPFKVGACGTTACITVTPAQLVNGACPSAAVAQARFSDPNCPGTITAVDGSGTLDGNLCCYSVETQNSNDLPLSLGECSGVGGGGNGVGGSSTDVVSSSGFGGAGGGIPDAGSCATCLDVINGAPPSTLCPGAEPFLDDMVTCICADGGLSGECQASCGDTLCEGAITSTDCADCLASGATCMGAVNVCESN